jgi:hypothetical protein
LEFFFRNGFIKVVINHYIYTAMALAQAGLGLILGQVVLMLNELGTVKAGVRHF